MKRLALNLDAHFLNGLQFNKFERPILTSSTDLSYPSQSAGICKLPNLLVTRRLGEAILENARRRFNVTVWHKDEPIGADLEEAAQGQDALLVMTTDVLDSKRLERVRRGGVQAIATFSVGHERIDVPAASRLGMPIFNTPDVLSDAVADIALFLILAANRGTTSAEHAVRSESWGPWSPTTMLGRQLRGLSLGIYGMGGIGRAIAHRARAFGLVVHYHNRGRLGPSLEQDAVFHEHLDSLMQISDVLCICAPASAQTRGSIDARRLSLMPAGATVVNIARGDLVDEDALIGALADGRLANAGLDVFLNEPDIDVRFLRRRLALRRQRRDGRYRQRPASEASNKRRERRGL